VDLTGTDIGDSILISAVALPNGVTPVEGDRDFTIATIAAPTIEVEPEETEEGEAAEGEETKGEGEEDGGAEE
jgi:large subunit ribosomal protein L25